MYSSLWVIDYREKAKMRERERERERGRERERRREREREREKVEARQSSMLKGVNHIICFIKE